MKEERIEILKMLQDGVITVDDAEKLLSALNSGEEKSRSEAQYKRNRDHSFDGNFFGGTFFKELDKGLSGLGKMFEGKFDNFRDIHPYKSNDNTYRDFESVYTENGRIIIEQGDILEIRQQIKPGRSGSCDIELNQSNGKDILVDGDEDNSYEVKRKDDTIVVICYDDCRISIPEGLRETSVKLINGDMEIRDINCPFRAETLNGDISIKDCMKVNYVKSLSGDIECKISDFFEGICDISTLSGDVVLSLPDCYSGMINAKAMSGEIICELDGDVFIKKESNMIQEKQVIEINKGSSENSINCSTLSGDITIESV